MKTVLTTLLCIATTSSLLFAQTAWKADSNGEGISGSFFTPGNWDNGIPNSSTDALFNRTQWTWSSDPFFGTFTVDIQGAAASKNVYFGNPGKDLDVTFDFGTGGSYTFTNLVMGEPPQGPYENTLRLVGSGTVNATVVQLGSQHGGKARLEVLDSVKLETEYLQIGDASSRGSSVLVSGKNAKVTVNYSGGGHTILMGANGSHSNQLTVADGGQFVVPNSGFMLSMGHTGSQYHTLEIDNGVVDANCELVLGTESTLHVKGAKSDIYLRSLNFYNWGATNNTLEFTIGKDGIAPLRLGTQLSWVGKTHLKVNVENYTSGGTLALVTNLVSWTPQDAFWTETIIGCDNAVVDYNQYGLFITIPPTYIKGTLILVR